MKARATLALSAVLVVLGVVLLAETARVGGTIGYALGVLFVAAGVGRAYLIAARDRQDAKR
jgi:dipeptide/tripeptide permease